MTYCYPCKRSFASPAGLRQHLKSSSAHPYCVPCDTGFQTDSGYLSHRKSKHEPECRTCPSHFHSWEDLDAHWRTSEVHPRCTRCALGFEEYRSYMQHMSERHASVACATCYGQLVPQEDLQKHYLESPRHPTCNTCHSGFADDAAYIEHGSSIHPESRCKPCGRQFDSTTLLAEHLLHSGRHPTCTECKRGFVHERAFNEHMHTHLGSDEDDITHAQLSPDQETLTSGSETPTKSHLTVNGLDVNGYKLSVITTPSEADLTDMVQNFLSPSPSPARPSSGFTLPSPPGSADSETSSTTSSPFGGSDLGLPSVGAVPEITILSTGSPVRRGTAADSVSGPPIPARLHIPGSGALGVHLRFSSHASSSDSAISALSLPSALLPHIGTAAPPTHARLFDEEELSQSSSQVATPTLAPQEWLATRTQEARKHPLAQVVPSPSPSPELLSPMKRTRSLVRCRACERDPCEVPTATMCGHVFCKGCIEREVMQTSRCPVCEQALLLYCLWKLDLTA